MVTIHVVENGVVRQAERVEPEWLGPSSTVTVWVDLAQPSDADLAILVEPFKFHPLSVEDARSKRQFPKIEQYPGYLYAILHDLEGSGAPGLATRDIDFFVGHSYLVTVHDGSSLALGQVRSACVRHERLMADGAVGLFHRIVDNIVDHYRPAMDALETKIDQMEEEAYAGRDSLVRRAIRLRRELTSMRRVLVPQRDAMARLARREFTGISDEMSFRFRDVHDHVVRVTEETLIFQDRVTGILEVHLAAVSNRLNQVMKVLTVMSTIFLPLTVLTSMWGMNVPLPHLPGGEAAQFWWVLAIMLVLSGGMLALFRRMRWM